MIKSKGFNWFGYFDGMKYNNETEPFEDYLGLNNKVSKELVIKHIETLEPALTSMPTFDIFTGEKLEHAGMFIDGSFLFPTDFLHYYKKCDIGIPLEYEEYLIKKGVV